MSQRASLFFVCLLFLLSPISFALQLDVNPQQIKFTNDATPITLELSVFDGNKPVRWDSKKLKGLSSKITVLNMHGESLGRNSDSGLKFMPIGTADGLTYRLVGVVDRSIINNRDFEIVINVGSNANLVKMVSVTIPELDAQNQKTTLLNESTLDNIIKGMEEIKKDTDRTLYWVAGLGLGVILTMIGLLAQIFFLKKSDNVTLDEGREIKRLQERESYSIQKAQTDSHNRLFQQGSGILASTDKVYEKTNELIKVTDKIDNDLRGFAKNPEQYSEQMEKDFKRLKKLVRSVSSNSKSNNDDLSAWVSEIEENRQSIERRIADITHSVNYFINRAEDYDEHMVRLYEYIVNLSYKQEEDMRKRVREVTEDHMERMGIDLSEYDY